MATRLLALRSRVEERVDSGGYLFWIVYLMYLAGFLENGRRCRLGRGLGADPCTALRIADHPARRDPAGNLVASSNLHVKLWQKALLQHL